MKTWLIRSAVIAASITVGWYMSSLANDMQVNENDSAARFNLQDGEYVTKVSPERDISFQYDCQAQRRIDTAQNGKIVCYLTNTGSVASYISLTVNVSCDTINKEVWRVGNWVVYMKSPIIQPGKTKRVTGYDREYMTDEPESENKLDPDVMICDTISYSNFIVFDNGGNPYDAYIK